MSSSGIPVADWQKEVESQFPSEEERAEFVRSVIQDSASNPGRKDDAGKPAMRLVPPRAILEVARVLEFGSRKYSPENWRRVPELQDRYLDAALRHVNAHQRGEILDGETGLSHLAHATCCLLFILEDGLLAKESNQ